MEKQFNQEITDATSMTAPMIRACMVIDCLKYTLHKEGEAFGNYYVGIAGDMEDNYSRHKGDEFGKKDFEYVSIYECASAEIAAKVEIYMKKIGFDIGNTDVEGCGGNENSIYVYMFRKPVGEEFHESLDELLTEYAKKRL